MPAKSKAQQRFMGMVHAAQKGELDNPSKEVEKAADSMSDADAKDYASTKHKGLPNHVRKENMEKELKEIIRQTYRESLRESINEAKYPTNLYVGSVIYGQGFTGLKGIEGGKYYKVVEMDDYSATLAPCDEKGKIKGSKKVRHKLSSLEGGIATAKRGDENGIVIESIVNETVSHEAMGIASMTNTRKEAVQKFIDDNNLNAKEILNHVTKGKLPERIRFVQALVGTPNNSSFKWYVKNYANESVTEGKKVFKINPPIGSSKYSISAHDGITKHKDGSPFYNILIFKNKADLERRANYFRSEKYIEESVNESDEPSDIIKDLDKLRNELIKKVEVLIAKKKKLYSNVDITTPMSADEKQLDKDIQSIFSEIQSIIQQKRKINK